MVKELTLSLNPIHAVVVTTSQNVKRREWCPRRRRVGGGTFNEGNLWRCCQLVLDARPSSLCCEVSVSPLLHVVDARLLACPKRLQKHPTDSEGRNFGTGMAGVLGPMAEMG